MIPKSTPPSQLHFSADGIPHPTYHSVSSAHSPSKFVVKTVNDKGKSKLTREETMSDTEKKIHSDSGRSPRETWDSWKPRYHAISHVEYFSGEPDELKYLGPVKPPKVDYCRIVTLLLPHCGSERKCLRNSDSLMDYRRNHFVDSPSVGV